MIPVYEKLEKCCRAVKEKIGGFRPEIAIVLGTGLNSFGTYLDQMAVVEFQEIEGFPLSTVAGHAGRFLFGCLNGIPAVVMQGRVHYYEGYSMEDIVLPIRLMGVLGARVLILTNGSGAVNLDYEPGDLMLIRDHISLFVPSPLTGRNPDCLGPRFPDMTVPYHQGLSGIIARTAKELSIPLRQGVYAQVSGPQYETPQEIHLLRLLGADAVGMSTACEAIAGNHMGMMVCGISSIDNMGAGICREKLVHNPKTEVSEAFQRLMHSSVRHIYQYLLEEGK